MKFTKNLVKQKVGTMLITKLKTFVDHIEQLFYSLEELNFSFLVCVCLGQKLENDPKVDDLVDDEVGSIESLSLCREPEMHLLTSASEVARSAAERAL